MAQKNEKQQQKSSSQYQFAQQSEQNKIKIRFFQNYFEKLGRDIIYEMLTSDEYFKSLRDSIKKYVAEKNLNRKYLEQNFQVAKEELYKLPLNIIKDLEKENNKIIYTNIQKTYKKYIYEKRSYDKGEIEYNFLLYGLALNPVSSRYESLIYFQSTIEEYNKYIQKREKYLIQNSNLIKKLLKEKINEMKNDIQNQINKQRHTPPEQFNKLVKQSSFDKSLSGKDSRECLNINNVSDGNEKQNVINEKTSKQQQQIYDKYNKQPELQKIVEASDSGRSSLSNVQEICPLTPNSQISSELQQFQQNQKEEQQKDQDKTIIVNSIQEDFQANPQDITINQFQDQSQYLKQSNNTLQYQNGGQKQFIQIQSTGQQQEQKKENYQQQQSNIDEQQQRNEQNEPLTIEQIKSHFYDSVEYSNE